MRAIRRAGIEDLRFHDLRHEATTRLFEKGLNIMEVASITGHKDLRMLRRYTHLKAEDLALTIPRLCLAMVTLPWPNGQHCPNETSSVGVPIPQNLFTSSAKC
jgi:hypothetical protein